MTTTTPERPLSRLSVRLDAPIVDERLRAELAAHVTNGWQGSAACRARIDDAWFPEMTEPGLRAAAVACCVVCPVRRSCLAFALSAGEEHGIWGGTTEVQRDALRIDLAGGVAVVDVLNSATVRPAYLWRRTA